MAGQDGCVETDGQFIEHRPPMPGTCWLRGDVGASASLLQRSNSSTACRFRLTMHSTCSSSANRSATSAVRASPLAAATDRGAPGAINSRSDGSDARLPTRAPQAAHLCIEVREAAGCVAVANSTVEW